MSSNLYTGTYSKVSIRRYKDTEYILKEYHFNKLDEYPSPTQFKMLQEIVYRIINCRKVLNNYEIVMPRIDKYIITTRDNNLNYILLIKEQYCGPNVENIIKNNLLRIEEINKILNEIKKYLFRLPKTVYIDAHPKNFTYLLGNIYYVDEIPPIQTFKDLNNTYKELFPIFEDRSTERSERRLWRYTNPDGRISKFNYYLKQCLINNTIPQ